MTAAWATMIATWVRTCGAAIEKDIVTTRTIAADTAIETIGVGTATTEATVKISPGGA